MSPEQVSENKLIPLYEAPRFGVLAGWGHSWKKIRPYHFLVRQMVKINLQREFKRSIIGLSWLFILPLLAMAIWILMNGAGIVNPGALDIPYPAYVLLSTSIWGFFVEIYRGTSNILANNGKLFLTATFPYEVQVIEQVMVHLIRFSIPFGLNLLVLVYFGIQFSWVALLFPLTLLPLLLLGLTIGLVVSLFRIVATDLGVLVDEGMRLLMFLTPIIYAPKIQLGWLSEIVRINPLTYLVSFSRDVLTKGTFYEPEIYSVCCLVVLVLFLVVHRFYTAAHPRIIERLIAG